MLTSTDPRKNVLAETTAKFKDFLELQIGRKAAEACLPCLNVLASAMKGQLPEKDALQSFEEAIEKANLMSSVLGQGSLLREGLSIVNEAVKVASLLGDLSIEENRYKAINASLVFKKFDSDEIIARMAFLQKSTDYQEVNLTEAVPSFVSELGARVSEHVACVKSELEGLFHPLDLPDLEIPDELETVSDLESSAISDAFLDKHFSIDSVKSLTDACLQMKDALEKTESISSKCGYPKLVDVSSFRIGYQKAMRYLCLASGMFDRCRLEL